MGSRRLTAVLLCLATLILAEELPPPPLRCDVLSTSCGATELTSEILVRFDTYATATKWFQHIKTNAEVHIPYLTDLNLIESNLASSRTDFIVLKLGVGNFEPEIGKEDRKGALGIMTELVMHEIRKVKGVKDAREN